MNFTIRLAEVSDIRHLRELDSHIPPARLEDCVRNRFVYVLCGEDAAPVGVLRYSLFWQTIPFLDLLYLRAEHRNHGFGTAMMNRWEQDMARRGYQYVMTSTQADETAKYFYEKRGYRHLGAFLPPDQEVDELIYGKNLCNSH